MKKILGAVSALLLLLGSFPLTATARNFVPPGVNPKTEDKIAFTVQDKRFSPDWISILVRPTSQLDNPTLGNRWCLSLTTENCKLEPGYIIQGQAILPTCVADEINCIESFSLSPSGSAEVQAQEILGIDKGFGYDAVPSLGVPEGAGPALFRATGAPNSEGSELYVVSASLGFEIRDGRPALITGLSVAVYPVVELSGSNYRPAEIRSREVNGVTMWNHDNGEQGSNDGCSLTTTGKCWARTDFAPDVEVKVSVRVSNQVSGWLHGRLEAPTVEVSSQGAASKQITIAAKPVNVPMMYAELVYSELDDSIKQIFSQSPSTGGFNEGDRWEIFPSFDYRARTLISKYSGKANDQAAAVQSSWQFNTINSNDRNQFCFRETEGLVGLVTTNAMAYDQNAPQFKDGSLDYSVAGLHKQPDGSLAVGVYDLVMRSDVARCLYGFSKAPISAKISVLSAAGESVVATTTVSEKDGWLKLAAYGFTFSEKRIKVQVTQPQQKVLSKFAGSSVRLSAKQLAELQSFAAKASGASSITCSTSYFGPSQKALAMKRAAAVCSNLRRELTEVRVVSKVVAAKRTSDTGKTFLSSK